MFAIMRGDGVRNRLRGGMASATWPTSLVQESGRALRLRDRLLVLLPLAAFVSATTQWMSWQEPIRGQFAADVDDYEKIARAAPHFTWPEIEGHVAMWPVHYLVGALSTTTHIPLHTTYYILAFAVLAAIVAIMDRLLCGLRIGLPVYALAMGALLLNPYVFRYLALAPGMINDTVFIASVCLAVWGLFRRRLGWVYGALALAAVARGLSVPPVLVGVAAWLAFGPWSEHVARGRRLAAASGALALPTAAFALSYWAGKKAPGDAEALKNCCGVSDLTIWGDLSGLPGSAGALAVHVGRVGIGLAMPLALLCAALLLLIAAGARRLVPTEAWWVLGIAGLMVAQPFLISSEWNAGAEPRLSSLAIGPAVTGVALVLASLQAEPGTARVSGQLLLGRADVLVLLAVFAAGSFSHRFARFGPGSAGQFAVLELVSATLVVCVLAGTGLLRRNP